jgi:hypothetical protein
MTALPRGIRKSPSSPSHAAGPAVGAKAAALAVTLRDSGPVWVNVAWQHLTREDPPSGTARESELAAVAAAHKQVSCLAALVGLEPGPAARPRSGWTQTRR